MSITEIIRTYEEALKEDKLCVTCEKPAAISGSISGLVLLDAELPHFHEGSIAGYFSLLFNELGLPSGDVGNICVVPPDERDNEEIASLVEGGFAVVLYDFRDVFDALLPHGSIICEERGSFRNDTALEWKYVGDKSIIAPERLAMFRAANRSSFELALMRDILGHAEVRELAFLGDGLYDRAKAVFDALLVGFAEFPMTQEQVDDMLAYLVFMDEHKDASPRPLTPGVSILPVEGDDREYGAKLLEAGKTVRWAIELWDTYSRSSGAGLVPIQSFSHMLRDPVKMPLCTETRKAIADAIGVTSGLDALTHGVPIMDLLA